MEARQRIDARYAERRDEHVVDPRIFEIHAEPSRARNAAEAVFAASECGPSVSDRVGERRERERQQRKINTAPAQHEETDEDRCDEQKQEREQCRPDDGAREPVTLRKRRGVGAEAKPRAMAK
jgi:hypothetical protein